MPGNFAFISALLIFTASAPALAYDLGEITEVRGSTIRFFKGDEVVNENEQLKVLNTQGKVNFDVRATKVDGGMADAVVTGAQFDPETGFLEALKPGQKVRLRIVASELSSGSFFAGANFSEKTGDFGGTNYTVGLRYMRPFKERMKLSFVLQADDLGKDSLGVGKRKAYYMGGVGYELCGFLALAHIGVVDIMTIPIDGTTQTIRDPYGGSYPAGVQHTLNFGY